MEEPSFLDLNVPHSSSEQGDQCDPQKDTISFLQELMPQDAQESSSCCPTNLAIKVEDKGDEPPAAYGVKRKRSVSEPEPEKERTVMFGGNSRTVDRYYDYPCQEQQHDDNKKPQNEGDKDESEMRWKCAVSGDGFEVTDFVVTCLFECFPTGKSRREAVVKEIETRPLRLRINRFESEDEGIGVLLASGQPKHIRLEHLIPEHKREYDLDKGEVTFIFSQGFRFRNAIEFDVISLNGRFQDVLCSGAFRFSDLPDPRIPLLVCSHNYFQSNAKLDSLYRDLHRYELHYDDDLSSVDRLGHVRLTFYGRILADFMDLAYRELPISTTSINAILNQDEGEDEEEED